MPWTCETRDAQRMIFTQKLRFPLGESPRTYVVTCLSEKCVDSIVLAWIGVISSQRVDLLLYVRQLSPYFKKLSFDLLVWSWTIVVKVNITAPCWRRSPARYLFLLGRRLSWQGNSTKCCLKEQDTGQYCLDKMHFRLGQWNASETVLMRSHTIEHPTWSRIFCKAIILFGCCDVLWAA